MFELSDIDLAHQRRDILVVLIARLGLCDSDLPELRRAETDNLELRDVAAELIETLDGPRTHDSVQAMLLDAVAFGEKVHEFCRAKQSKRRFEDRADRVSGLQDIDGHLLHQVLQPFGER